MEINGCVSTILIKMMSKLIAVYKLYSTGIFRQPVISRIMKRVTTAQFKTSINVNFPERRVWMAYQYVSHGGTSCACQSDSTIGTMPSVTCLDRRKR